MYEGFQPEINSGELNLEEIHTAIRELMSTDVEIGITIFESFKK